MLRSHLGERPALLGSPEFRAGPRVTDESLPGSGLTRTPARGDAQEQHRAGGSVGAGPQQQRLCPGACCVAALRCKHK